MNVNKIDNVGFGAGKVNLSRINPDEIKSYGAIKKIAESKDINIYIEKNSESKYMPKEDMYVASALKDNSVKTGAISGVGKDVKLGTSCAILNKQIKPEEFSVKMYNMAMRAIESLERKLDVKSGLNSVM